MLNIKLLRRIFLPLLSGMLVLPAIAYSDKLPDDLKGSKYSNWYQVSAHNAFEKYGMFGKEILPFVNSLEYDIHPNYSWGVYHNVPSETLCHHSLNVCLKDVRDYHDKHPNHPLLTIFIEIKTESGFKVTDFNGIFCGEKRNINSSGKATDDAVFACAELFRPGDLLINNQTSLRQAIAWQKWKNLEDMSGKILFVVNGPAGVLKKYLDETRIGEGSDRTTPIKPLASAFVMVDNVQSKKGIDTLCESGKYTASNNRCQDKHAYFDTLGTTSKNKDKYMKNIIFFNATCGDWLKNPTTANYVREKNFISRAYSCDYQDEPEKALTNLVHPLKLNFVAYDNIAKAFKQGHF